jgi:hypothetical protein
VIFRLRLIATYIEVYGGIHANSDVTGNYLKSLVYLTAKSIFNRDMGKAFDHIGGEGTASLTASIVS